MAQVISEPSNETAGELLDIFPTVFKPRGPHKSPHIGCNQTQTEGDITVSESSGCRIEVILKIITQLLFTNYMSISWIT